MDCNEEFARWFRIELAKRGWKGTDLLREMQLKGQGVAPATISKWRKGQVQASRENCALLVDMFEFPVATVLAIAGHEPLEDGGPFAEIGRRLASLPNAVRKIAVNRITEYSDKTISLLEQNLTSPQTILDKNLLYAIDSAHLLHLLERLDDKALAAVITEAQAILQKSND